MNFNFNIKRAELWKNEIFHLLELYNEFLTEFKLNLYSCSMERISFCNDEFFFHVTYSFDRYQIEQNTEMPIAMIVFGNGSIEKNIIEVFKEKINTVDIYAELRLLNQKTKNQGLTYQILLNEYLTPLIKQNQLF